MFQSDTLHTGTQHSQNLLHYLVLVVWSYLRCTRVRKDQVVEPRAEHRWIYSDGVGVRLVVHVLLTTVALSTHERAVGGAVTPWAVHSSQPVKPVLSICQILEQPILSDSWTPSQCLLDSFDGIRTVRERRVRNVVSHIQLARIVVVHILSLGDKSSFGPTYPKLLLTKRTMDTRWTMVDAENTVLR